MGLAALLCRDKPSLSSILFSKRRKTKGSHFSAEKRPQDMLFFRRDAARRVIIIIHPPPTFTAPLLTSVSR
jgi:hypothetical protein